MCQIFDRRWNNQHTYPEEYGFAFEEICARYVDEELPPYAAVWVHMDGRTLGMTGFSTHKIDSLPAGYYLHHSLSNDVDIYYRSDYMRTNT